MKILILIKQIFCPRHEFEYFDCGETNTYWWTEYRCKYCGEKKIIKGRKCYK